MNLLVMLLNNVPAESVSVDTSVVLEKWWVPFLGTILTALAALVTLAVKKLVSKILEKMSATEAEKEAVQYLLDGMAKAQDEFVREAKVASADGKLTKEEIEKAKKLAIEHALSLAKGPAKDVLVAMGQERLGSLIKQLLAKFSKKE